MFNNNAVLSVCIPAYNEEKSLEAIVERLLNVDFVDIEVTLDVIIVNDCSKDQTKKIAENLVNKHPSIIRLINNEKNLGKSQTVKRGFLAAKTESNYVVCQDADLEYDPSDLVYMIQRLVKERYDVAYGNRFGHYTEVMYKKNFYGNLLLSIFSSIFTTPRIKVLLPDMEVCYKMIRTDVAKKIAKGIVSKSNFGIEPEMTAKLSKYKINGRPLKFVVTPTQYYPRSIEDGKKMKAFKDGAKAMLEIIRFNVF